MTILNHCHHGDRFFCAFDSAVSPSGDRIAKAIVLPHLRMLVAGAGSALIIHEWQTHLLRTPMPRAATVVDIDAATPGELRTLWATIAGAAKQDPRPTYFILAGIDRTERVRAFQYLSDENFESHELAPGIYVMPTLDAPRLVVAPAPDDPETPTKSPLSLHVERPISWQWPWHKAVMSVTNMISRQRRQMEQRGEPVGEITCILLDPFGARVTFDGDIGAAEVA